MKCSISKPRPSVILDSILFDSIWKDFAILLSGNFVWNKSEVSWFELLKIPFKQQCNANISSAEIFSELNTLISKVCCFDEELSLSFEVVSSNETGGPLTEDLRKKKKKKTRHTAYNWNMLPSFLMNV